MRIFSLIRVVMSGPGRFVVQTKRTKDSKSWYQYEAYTTEAAAIKSAEEALAVQRRLRQGVVVLKEWCVEEEGGLDG